jgi:hypothetical protein
LTITDGGAQGLFNISTTGALLSLVNSGTGIQVKTSSTAITGRSIAISGAGLAITDGNGIAGDPTIALTGQVLNLANASINGFVVLTSAGAITSTTLTGTANQIGITNPTGVGNPVFSIANDPVMPGNGAMTIPVGTTGQQPVASTAGMIRYDTTQGAFYGYSGSAWNQFSLSGGVTQVNTGTGLTGGPITGIGTISLDVTTVTAGSYGSTTQVGTFTVNAQGQLTLAGNTTVTPAVGSITGLGTGVATALAVNVGSAGAIVVNGGVLGTPSSGTVTNLTGTASININGTVGATTANTGAFTTISATGVITSTLATGTAPFTVASTTTVANLGATNTVNTAVTANSTNATNYLTFVSNTSGNLGQLVNSSITCNPSTGVITGGISGGTF